MNAAVENWFQKIAPDKAAIFYEIRKMILDLHEGIEERFTYQTPFYHFHGLLFYFAIHKTKKNRAVLGICNGFLIPDAYGFLHADEGQTQIRHLYIDETIPNETILKYYLLEALQIKLNKTQ